MPAKRSIPDNLQGVADRRRGAHDAEVDVSLQPLPDLDEGADPRASQVVTSREIHGEVAPPPSCLQGGSERVGVRHVHLAHYTETGGPVRAVDMHQSVLIDEALWIHRPSVRSGIRRGRGWPLSRA
jgi:hypothetical protein